VIDVKNQAERLEAYQAAYKVAKGEAEQIWHPAWRTYHELYTRRSNGAPLLPSTLVSSSEPGAAASATSRLDPEKQLAVNHIQSILRTIMASTFNRSPEFSLLPEYPGFDAPMRAKLAGCALNSAWRNGKFNDPIREAYEDSLQYGRGWVRHGWQASYTREVLAPGADGATPRAVLVDALNAVNEMSRQGARLGHKAFTPEEVQQHMARFGGKLLVEDRPTLRHVSAFDVFFDPMAQNFYDARWVAQRWRCPIAFAKKNAAWSDKARKALSQKGLEGMTDDPAVNPGEGDPIEYGGKDVVWIVDFFDLGEGKWCQFAEGGTEYLLKPGDIPFPFGHPFVPIENIEDTGSGQPISEIEVIWPHQQTLANIASELGIDRVQSRGKVLVRKEDAEQLRPAFESSEQGFVIPVEMPPNEGNIEQSYKFIQPQSRGAQLSQMQNMETQAMASASGVSDYLRGGGGVGETATEVNAKQSAAANFFGEKASRVRDFIEANAQRTLAMIQVFSRLDFFIETKGMNPETGAVQDVSLSYGKDKFQGAYRVIVSADSTEQKTPQARMARAQAIASTSIPFMQAGVVDPGKLYSWLMKEGFDMEDPTILLTQQAFMPPAPAQPGAQAGTPELMGGVSMTPGSQAGQLGASAAATRTDNGDSVPTTEG